MFPLKNLARKGLKLSYGIRVTCRRKEAGGGHGIALHIRNIPVLATSKVVWFNHRLKLSMSE